MSQDDFCRLPLALYKTSEECNPLWTTQTLPSSHITWCWLTVVHIGRLSASLSFREGLGRKILEWKTCYVKGSDCVPAVQLQEKHFNQSHIVRFSCPDRGRSEFFKRLVNVWKAETHAEHSHTELCVVWLKTTHSELTQWFLSQLFVALALHFLL